MKILSLNLWGGRVSEPLFRFLETHRDVDVFCFQEVFDAEGNDTAALYEAAAKGTVRDLYTRLGKALPEHEGLFLPVYDGAYGIATFVRRDLPVVASGSVTLYESPKFPDPENEDADHSRAALWVELPNLKVVNVHGHWVPSDKTDNPVRLEQSRRLLSAVGENPTRTVLCGDFNLRPDTESVRMIEAAGFRNLITEQGVTSTRTSLYQKSEKFADYAFVSKGVEVRSFEVLPDEVSDHAALLLEVA